MFRTTSQKRFLNYPNVKYFVERRWKMSRGIERGKIDLSKPEIASSRLLLLNWRQRRRRRALPRHAFLLPGILMAGSLANNYFTASHHLQTFSMFVVICSYIDILMCLQMASIWKSVSQVMADGWDMSHSSARGWWNRYMGSKFITSVFLATRVINW